ncbi:Zinc finger protein VAR3, chloroplastic [Heracleum sosnowskyi]|uniref:Zinc finger protein VAR3, chloroplastic n=1 Tax=Heracleum sosnowskyi TaxID=360622 RepID=A0AAD8MFB6_9APIA|nr:Zinc finger protein VAR3, chloroplastic [Heracleum sosnowskyi]
MSFSLLIRRPFCSSNYKHLYIHTNTYISSQLLNFSNYTSLSSSFSSSETEIKPNSPPPISPNDSKPTSLSSRMSFVFDQIDAIEKERSQKDETLQRIRAWRESKNKQKSEGNVGNEGHGGSGVGGVEVSEVEERKKGGLMSKEVELVHPWPEWIELMERLVQQNYFDHKRKDEDKMIEDLGFKMEEVIDQGFDFTRDWKTVQTACLNFGKDRFDIFRSLSRQDIQVLVGHGCPSTDKKVVFSAKLLRKHVHLDEGDVCSSCSLRSSCERGYLLTNKEDEARTIDIMRVLLTYGFDPVNGSVVNESILKIKSVKTVVRKLLHQVVKLSAVPIDPNLPPPVIKRPPPKVKQPPPPPRRRVGRDDIEMKKGDWLCPKCDFMNFAKNSVCLQCDSSRPKRQLLPGEWECPECNFLNYRRNVVCFHCECKRPPDEYTENKMQEKQNGFRTRPEKISTRKDSWNFDFDDNESDGADVASFEYADSHKLNEDFPEARWDERDNSRRSEDGFQTSNMPPRAPEREYSVLSRNQPGTGFDDFDDEEDDLESYEVDNQTRVQGQGTGTVDFSEIEADSESDDSKGPNDRLSATRRPSFPRNAKTPRPMHRNAAFSGSEGDELDFDSDQDIPVHPNWKSSHVANSQRRLRGRAANNFDSDEDIGLSSGSEDEKNHRSRNTKANKREPNRRDFGRRASHSSEDFSGFESDDEDVRSHRDKGNKASSDRRKNMSMGRGSFDGSERSGFKSRSMMGDRSQSSRDKFERPSRGPRGNDRGYDRDEFDGRARFDGSERSGFKSRGMMGDRNRPSRDKFERPSRGSHGNDRGFERDDYDGRRKGSGGGGGRNFNSSRRESFGKDQRGRNNFDNRATAGGSDSYFGDDRPRRPRNNVR